MKRTIERGVQKKMNINLPIIYVCSSEQGSITNKGITFYVSDSGICFYTQMPLREGLNLKIYVAHILDYPRSGIVRWCSKDNSDFYKVGVSFV